MTTPANPDDLATWLRAALDEIESDARFYLNSGADNGPGMEWAQLALARVAADRRILDDYEAALAESDSDPNDPTRSADASTLEWVVRLLALPFADRPGFREEWRPA